MFKKLSYLALLWCALIGYTVLTGCCEEILNVCLTSDKIEVVAYDNSDSLAVEAGDDFVFGKALMLRMSFTGSSRYCSSPRPASFITSAYATSCGKTYVYKHLDTVASIAVYADKDYDAQHPAGTSLNDLFYMPLVESFNARQDRPYYFDLYALQSPAQRDSFVYTIKLVLTDGTNVEASTKRINIVP